MKRWNTSFMHVFDVYIEGREGDGELIYFAYICNIGFMGGGSGGGCVMS